MGNKPSWMGWIVRKPSKIKKDENKKLKTKPTSDSSSTEREVSEEYFQSSCNNRFKNVYC